MSMRTRVVATATAVLLGAAGLALAPAATAAAPPYHGIDGGGGVTDDWQDEENLGVDDYPAGNATALWETVLWADGAQYQDDDGDSHPFEKSRIDGSFGPETESATQWWQEHFGLSDNDGVVTEQSWTFAQQRLTGPTSAGTVTYHGTAHNATLKRVSNKYRVRIKGTGPWKVAYYDRLG
ncbi:peptidoglycan-binding domain-containing protein [Streptomyces humi]|uniref:peptidoglycan-binding domain-containing protein n=1 Tax=Streptomyces humi TaxID=1428620 RepID=UPI00062890C6|nr:peptidoglycan-binding protein [Streptomyces humi]